MKSLIGVYNTHDKAIKAIKLLKGENFPTKDISMLGKTNVSESVVDEKEPRIDKNDPSHEAPLAIGAIAGPILGVLTGVGVFAIPGLGFLYGAGALVGALAGLDLGLVGGGIATLLATIGISKKHHVKFKEYLKNGKVILIARGKEEDIKRAHDTLVEYNEHHDLLTT